MIEIPADPHPSREDPGRAALVVIDRQRLTFDPEAVIDAMAPMVGLDPSAFDRAAVAENLRIVARFAAMVLDPPISDHAEPAAIFVPEPVAGRDDLP